MSTERFDGSASFGRVLDLLAQARLSLQSDRLNLSGNDWMIAKDAQLAIESIEYQLGMLRHSVAAGQPPLEQNKTRLSPPS